MLHLKGTKIEFVGARKGKANIETAEKPIVEDGNFKKTIKNRKRLFTFIALAKLNKATYGRAYWSFGDLEKYNWKISGWPHH